MPESYLSFGEETLFCRHNEIVEQRPSLLLVHGLGDSGLTFAGVFEDERSKDFNIVVPDLLGYGRSGHSPAERYSFDDHIDHLWRIIDHFGLERITVVGHSMGGDLGSLLCRQDGPSGSREPRIARFINVEGNLTEHDLFISGKAAQATEDGRFEEWLSWDFTYRQVFGDWCQRWPFGRRYLASLQFCDPVAFRRNAIEIHRRGGPEAGISYCDLPIPKLFVFGQRSLHPESRRFISRNQLIAHEIVGSHHWPMLDCADEFYEALFGFCRGQEVGAESRGAGGLPRGS